MRDVFDIIIKTDKEGGVKKNGNKEVWGKKKQNQDGLTTSVHSHCSMSSMTEPWRPTP